MPLLVLLALPAQAALMLATPQPLMPGATMSHALPTQRSRAAALIFGVVMCADRDNFRFGTGRPGNPFWNRRLYGGTRCVALATTASSELSASPTRTRSQAASVKRSFGGPAEFKSSFDFRPRLLLHMNMSSLGRQFSALITPNVAHAGTARAVPVVPSPTRGPLAARTASRSWPPRPLRRPSSPHSRALKRRRRQ